MSVLGGMLIDHEAVEKAVSDLTAPMFYHKANGQDYVLNRARLYRNRRDFVIQTGDTGRREDYPDKPAASVRRVNPSA